ncbi:MAG: hypothetical protein L0191_12435 [Acidobacteria bacterium]|nr:hypothetical protein [Acidobacteriota bacterium]
MRFILPSGERDEVLEFNGGFLWVALLFLMPAAMLQFALAAQIGPSIPFAAASLVIMLLLVIESRRPTYPFRFLQSETPPDSLTDRQRRVLTYLRSREGLRSKYRLGGALVVLTAVATGLPPFLGKVPEWVTYYLFVRPGHVVNDSVFFLLLISVFQAVATYAAVFGWSCWRPLCRWDEIQTTFEPWPLPRTAEIFRAFRIVSKPARVGEEGTATRAPGHTHPRAPLLPSTPVSGRQVLAVICFMLGAPALFVGATSLPRTLASGGLTPGSELAADFGLVVGGLVFLCLGGYLWRR